MTDEQDIEIAVNAARVAGFVPYLQQMVEKLEHGVEIRVRIALESGKLTPEIALNAWIEKLAYRRILTRTQQQAQIIEDIASPTIETMRIPSYVQYN